MSPGAPTTVQDLSSSVVTDPQVLANIPLPMAATTADTPIVPSKYGAVLKKVTFQPWDKPYVA